MRMPSWFSRLAIVILLTPPLFAAAPPRPNIVLLISEQQFADAMSCAGCDHVNTPALDGLAASGVRFASTCRTYPDPLDGFQVVLEPDRH